MSASKMITPAMKRLRRRTQARTKRPRHHGRIASSGGGNDRSELSAGDELTPSFGPVEPAGDRHAEEIEALTAAESRAEEVSAPAEEPRLGSPSWGPAPTEPSAEAARTAEGDPDNDLPAAQVPQSPPPPRKTTRRKLPSLSLFLPRGH
jgi:hypothetical protein